MNYVGININTVPALDVRRKKGHNIIGNRSFSNNPGNVKKLGSLCIDLYKKNNLATKLLSSDGGVSAGSNSRDFV